MEPASSIPDAWARAKSEAIGQALGQPLVKRGRGRPLTYDAQLAEVICDRLASSALGLAHICQAEDLPTDRTIYKWLDRFPDFVRLYARAREQQADFVAAETVWIADNDPDPQRARNRILARQWMAAKLNPRRYGDKLGVDVTVAGDLGDRLNAAFQAASSTPLIESTAIDVTPKGGADSGAAPGTLLQTPD